VLTLILLKALCPQRGGATDPQILIKSLPRDHRASNFARMSSQEFHALLDEYAWESEVDRRDLPLTLARLAEFERQKGVKFPAFYKETLSMYGAADFGSITVLSPDPDSQFRISETTSQLEDREFNFMGITRRTQSLP
jgi:hypothetical protein